MVDEIKKEDEKSESAEKSFKEQRIREITMIYYSRPKIRKAIFEFGLNREVIPKYYEGFGKRPDSLQFEGDVLEHVRKGTTSFHCSEELWKDVLDLSTEMSRDELDSLREGWDLLLDIDSKYLEYSKIYAILLVDVLKFHGVENIGVKFSGSKGFHIIIPWKAFPEEIYGKETKDMFPEWARVVCEYLSEIIKPKLAEKIFEEQNLGEIAKRTGRGEEELIITECKSCGRGVGKKFLVSWGCDRCKEVGEVVKLEINKRIPKCPECRRDLVEKRRDEIYFCEFCNLRSDKNPEMFGKTRAKTETLIDADLVLVAPRHLFRMPYSLHEKTALCSVVIDKDKIRDFQIRDAKPFKIGKEIKSFYPDCEIGEARKLLLQALDWYEQKQREEESVKKSKGSVVKFDKKDYKKITIGEPSEDIFPPQIKSLLKGMKQDGRKRALFILLSFFKCLGANEGWIERKINEWNEKNYQPLKKGYIMSQISWYRRNPSRLPPNFANSIYRELGVDEVDELVRQTKNPVGYAVKRYFQLRR